MFQQYPQNFLNADEVDHIRKQAAIVNLPNEVIVNKKFLHTNDKDGVSNGTIFSRKGICVFEIDNLIWGATYYFMLSI